LSQSIFQNHHHVFVQKVLGKDVYNEFEYHQHHNDPLSETQLYILLVQTTPQVQFLLCNSKFLAIVIHSLFVIKWYQAHMLLQASIDCCCVIQAIGYLSGILTGTFHEI